ncbi:proline iminopeptidase-family hydrolase [Streptomyces sp. NPDC048337]|uniref:proline iminopeptidase-family hydrolase n=1 Tax=Streptomyces sp. NPDC048337 TaxID=3365535 RepID=UPI00371E8E58
MTVTEGYASFQGFRTWYKIVGDSAGDKLPLLVVNGGPGCPHDYMADLEALAAEDGRALIFYDQLGCGRSDHPDDPGLWVIDTFVRELAAVRTALGLDRVHLLGHSFGAQVALEYVLTRPPGLATLTLAGPIADAPAYEAEARRLMESLPPEERTAIGRREPGADMAFYRRWLCRLDPWPEYVVEAFTGMSRDVYGTMWGGHEWELTGNLKGWTVMDRLGGLDPDLPVLVTSGRHDLTTPALVRPLAEAVPGAEWVLFEESAHLPFVEEPEHYRAVLASFLRRSEAVSGPRAASPRPLSPSR